MVKDPVVFAMRAIEQGVAFVPRGGRRFMRRTMPAVLEKETARKGFMSARMVGLRYERLLFLTGPLSLVIVLVFFVALATSRQINIADARCNESLAAAIDSGKATLERHWEAQRLRIDSQMGDNYDYKNALNRAWIGSTTSTKCFIDAVEMSAEETFSSPDVLAQNFRSKAASLRVARPLKGYGVEMPEKATLSVLGTSLTMELVTLAQWLQIALAPVLLLWLGSLYHTRVRESLYVNDMTDLRQLFPHIVNLYAHGRINRPKRRSWPEYYASRLLAFGMIPLIRVGLVALFIGPPVGFYMASLYLMPSDQYQITYLSLAVAIGIFAFTNLIGELAPWHVAKIFPPPRINSNA